MGNGEQETALSGEQESLADSALSNEGATAIPGPPTQLLVKSSIYSMEFWLTTIVSLGLGFAVVKGWLAPQAIDSTQSALVGVVHSLVNGQNVALVTILSIVYNFITSRGKTKSNALWATASMNNPLVKNDNLIGGSHAAAMPLMAQGLLGGSGGGLGGILSTLGGGSGVKDPNTWKGIANIVGQIAGGRTGKTITSITGQGGDVEFQAQVTAGFQALVDRAKQEEAVLIGLWNRLNPNKPVTSIEGLLTVVNHE